MLTVGLLVQLVFQSYLSISLLFVNYYQKQIGSTCERILNQMLDTIDKYAAIYTELGSMEFLFSNLAKYMLSTLPSPDNL